MNTTTIHQYYDIFSTAVEHAGYNFHSILLGRITVAVSVFIFLVFSIQNIYTTIISIITAINSNT